MSTFVNQTGGLITCIILTRHDVDVILFTGDLEGYLFQYVCPSDQKTFLHGVHSAELFIVKSDLSGVLPVMCIVKICIN